MANSIPFTNKLRQKVGTILEAADFRLTWIENSTVESVSYERARAGLYRHDKVEFSGPEGDDNWIQAGAMSGQDALSFLTTIKLLMPNEESLPFPESVRWDYANEAELEAVLDEIAALVKDRLLTWFELPPAELPPDPREIEIEKRKAEYQKAVESWEQAAQWQRAEGNIGKAEQYEKLAQSMRRFYALD